MPIPNAHLAVVTREKLTDYLLNVSHPVGGSKARWLISLGHSPDQPEALTNALLEIVHHGEASRVQDSGFGVKYTVSGRLSAPGRSVNVTTIWIAEPPDLRPRLVTAYPTRKATDERT